MKFDIFLNYWLYHNIPKIQFLLLLIILLNNFCGFCLSVCMDEGFFTTPFGPAKSERVIQEELSPYQLPKFTQSQINDRVANDQVVVITTAGVFSVLGARGIFYMGNDPFLALVKTSSKIQFLSSTTFTVIAILGTLHALDHLMLVDPSFKAKSLQVGNSYLRGYEIDEEFKQLRCLDKYVTPTSPFLDKWITLGLDLEVFKGTVREDLSIELRPGGGLVEGQFFPLLTEPIGSGILSQITSDQNFDFYLRPNRLPDLKVDDVFDGRVIPPSELDTLIPAERRLAPHTRFSEMSLPISPTTARAVHSTREEEFYVYAIPERIVTGVAYLYTK